MTIASTTDILITTEKDLTAALCHSQRNPLLPSPNTQTHHALVKLNEIFSNVTKPAESTHNNLPRLPMITIKNPSDLSRVPPITTTGFIDMTATNRRILRQNKKATNTPKTSNQPEIQKKPTPVPLPFPQTTPQPSSQPPSAPSNQKHIQRTTQPTIKLCENLESVNFVSIPVQLPPKLQHLINSEIK